MIADLIIVILFSVAIVIVSISTLLLSYRLIQSY
jgi:hypothetical protein